MIENYDPRAQWANKSWTLDSADLFERFGFQDGAIFEDLALAEQMEMPSQQEILKVVVEKFLLPKIGTHIELYDANTSHNRVRASYDYKGSFDHVEITITAKQIFDALDELE
ncbi:hypothetical protein OH460_08150 [Vibrio sp. Makdt]|uniref:hypothetical protein n=1 Tax=Vibrio sp. Makdt TaxID=2998828 RepID=UPI0022CD6AD8|nr:hypothetical protein [Vibrio sp. Makdt]MDA0152270.1 hypothetical protein [Vibrio sp. Makdt]